MKPPMEATAPRTTASHVTFSCDVMSFSEMFWATCGSEAVDMWSTGVFAAPVVFGVDLPLGSEGSDFLKKRIAAGVVGCCEVSRMMG